MGSTTVKTPAPTPPTAQETAILEKQAAQLDVMTQLQQEQLAQFREFGPAQMAALRQQEELSTLALEEARRAAPLQQQTLESQTQLLKLAQEEAARRAPFEQQTFETQNELLRLAKEDAQQRAKIDKLTLPVTLEAAGYRPVFDASGNIQDIEKIPAGEQTSLQKVQEQFALESAQESLKALRGEVPVGDPFERRIEEDRRGLHENLRRQLGPGYETSTPGIQALAEFEAKTNEARENIRFGRLTQTAALADISGERLNQQLLQELQILQGERASTLPGAFSMAGGVGSRAGESLARAFALAGDVRAGAGELSGRAFGMAGDVGGLGSSSFARAAGLAANTGQFAAGLAGQYATDRRLIDQYNTQAAIQSAANRAQQTAGIFGAFGTAAGVGVPLYLKYSSSRAVKENNAPVDKKEILDGVKRMSVEKWNYKPETGLANDPHIGPYAEEFREKFGVGDGKTINMIDAVGVLFAAVQALAEKLEPEGGEADATGIS